MRSCALTMSKADRFAARTTRYQEMQRLASKAKVHDWSAAPAALEPIPTKPSKRASNAWAVNATTSNSSIPIYGTSGTFTVPITGWSTGTTPIAFTGSGMFTYQYEPPAEEEPRFPADDPTRAMVERAILAAVDDCLAANHYPKGIAMSDTAWSLITDSPLRTRRFDTFWTSTAVDDKVFMGIRVEVVETIDPLWVEVGW